MITNIYTFADIFKFYKSTRSGLKVECLRRKDCALRACALKKSARLSTHDDHA